MIFKHRGRRVLRPFPEVVRGWQASVLKKSLATGGSGQTFMYGFEAVR